MDIKRHDLLTKALQAVGLSPVQFVKDHLKGSYQAFRARVRNGRMYTDDIHKLCFYTGKTFEELFPNPLKKERNRITLNLGAFPSKTSEEVLSEIHNSPKGKTKTEKLRKEILKDIQPERLTPVEKISGEEENAPAAETPGEFKIESVFDDGLPPVI